MTIDFNVIPYDLKVYSVYDFKVLFDYYIDTTSDFIVETILLSFYDRSTI